MEKRVLTDKNVPTTGEKKILVVDDEPNVIKSLTFVLSKKDMMCLQQ